MKQFNFFLAVILLTLFFNSSNSFSQWVQTSGPTGVGEILALAVSDNNIFAGTRSGGVYLSTDNGQSWEQRNNGFANLWIRALAISGGNIFAGTYLAGVYKSTDSGLIWTKVHDPYEVVNTLYVTGNNIFEGTVDANPNYYKGGVYRSTDEGSTWVKLNTGLPLRPDVQNFTFNGNYLFTETYSEGTYRSSDNGANWELVVNGLPVYLSRTVRLISSGTNVFTGTQGYGIYKSTNDGANWISVNSGLPAGAVIGAFAVIGNNIFAGTSDSPEFIPKGIYLSTNNGSNWTAINNGLPANCNIKSIAIKNDLIFIGTAYEGGVWYRPLSELITDVEGEVSELPKEYKLEQNYPNPFNPTTTISFSIPQSQNVELKVFDILGNKVATLLNEYREAGEHKVKFSAIGGSAFGGDAYSLPSGIYFYRLKAGDFVQTKKLVLLK